MAKKAEKNKRAKPGVPGLDDMLNGGFIRGSAVLVAGSPGTGKTTLGLQFIYNGIKKYNENGLVITFEQLPDQLYADTNKFGWDLKKLEQQGKLQIMCTSPFVLQQMRIYKNKLDEIIKKTNAKRVLLDSVTLFSSLIKDKDKLRQEIYSLVNYFKTKKITVVFTHELPEIRGSQLKISEFGIDFLVDCIIILRYVEVGSEMKKSLLVLKLRGSKHDKSIREFEIGDKAIVVQTPFKNYENILGGSAFKEVSKEVDKFFNK